MKNIFIILILTAICVFSADAQKADRIKLTQVTAVKASKGLLKAIKAKVELKKMFKSKKAEISPMADYAIYKIEGQETYIATNSKVKKEFLEKEILALGRIQEWNGTYLRIIECRCLNKKNVDDCDFRKDGNGNTVCKSAGQCSDCRTNDTYFDSAGNELQVTVVIK